MTFIPGIQLQEWAGGGEDCLMGRVLQRGGWSRASSWPEESTAVGAADQKMQGSGSRCPRGSLYGRAVYPSLVRV